MQYPSGATGSDMIFKSGNLVSNIVPQISPAAHQPHVTIRRAKFPPPPPRLSASVRPDHPRSDEREDVTKMISRSLARRESQLRWQPFQVKDLIRVRELPRDKKSLRAVDRSVAAATAWLQQRRRQTPSSRAFLHRRTQPPYCRFPIAIPISVISSIFSPSSCPLHPSSLSRTVHPPFIPLLFPSFIPSSPALPPLTLSPSLALAGPTRPLHGLRVRIIPASSPHHLRAPRRRSNTNAESYDLYL